jgi:hypothetical protein
MSFLPIDQVYTKLSLVCHNFQQAAIHTSFSSHAWLRYMMKPIRGASCLLGVYEPLRMSANQTNLFHILWRADIDIAPCIVKCAIRYYQDIEFPFQTTMDKVSRGDDALEQLPSNLNQCITCLISDSLAKLGFDDDVWLPNPRTPPPTLKHWPQIWHRLQTNILVIYLDWLVATVGQVTPLTKNIEYLIKLMKVLRRSQHFTSGLTYRVMDIQTIRFHDCGFRDANQQAPSVFHLMTTVLPRQFKLLPPHLRQLDPDDDNSFNRSASTQFAHDVAIKWCESYKQGCPDNAKYRVSKRNATPTDTDKKVDPSTQSRYGMLALQKQQEHMLQNRKIHHAMLETYCRVRSQQLQNVDTDIS